ncbi:MAG: Ycf51 family protein [Leptolyngbyaceae cyanobacterium bins.59]|nr:Ycf51 family protein [Leptolyngbyaceae cyanobacterium bins.59]
MPTTADFFTATQWVGITTLVFAALTVLAFVLSWGIRFRLVGVTGFTAVLTGGLFALSLVPLTHTVIPGATKFSRTYDNGATQAVITVSPDITESQLEATLRQAAEDLFSFGRLGSGEDMLTIRARTLIHPSPGISQPLFLGQARRSLASREDGQMVIEIFKDRLSQIPKTSA